MESEVLFTPYGSVGEPDALNLRVREMLDSLGFTAELVRDEAVAVKIHPGEKNNATYVRPTLVRSVADLLSASGARPFVTETTTLYCRERFTADELRSTAAWNGFSDETMGCPFVVADNGPDAFVDVKGEHLDRAGIARAIADTGAMVVIAHVTGHGWTAGLAGAIKQLGMGCVGRETKARVHLATSITIDEGLCVICGSCAEACKSDAVDTSGETARLTDRCVRCGVCIASCSEEAIGYSHDYDLFARGLAEASSGVMSCFEAGKVAFVNVLADVTTHCDCEGFSESPAFPDLGVLVSTDPVAIDQASADLLNRSQLTSEFAAAHPEIADSADKLLAITGIEWWKQLDYAESLGLGSRTHTLTTTD